MSEPPAPPRPPAKTAARPPAGADRDTRLAEALRTNLHRRKTQARARRDQPPPAGGGDSADG